MSTLQEQTFLRDIAEHRLLIHRDEAGFRHLEFRRPTSRVMWFELVTWPGHLCYNGDMGSYGFSRLPDMFEFFRDAGTGPLRINPSYWAQKVVALDRDGVRRYSPEVFRAVVQRWLDDNGDEPPTAALRQAVAAQVLAHADDGLDAAVRAALAFKYDGRALFQDLWEVNLEEYTLRFLWCCYAMVWGIRQYDTQRAQAAGTTLVSGVAEKQAATTA